MSFVVPLITGIATGMVLYLSAAGMSLMISGMGVINFAQGAFYVMGMAFCYSLGTATHSFAVGIIAAVVVTFVFGGLLEIGLRPVSGKAMTLSLLTTMGIGYVIDAIFGVVFGVQVYSLKAPNALRGILKIGKIAIPKYYLFMIGASMLIAIAFWVMFKKTKLGMLFRAIISDRNMVEALGINVKLLYFIMFMIGTALSGFAGAINLPSSGFVASGSSAAFAAVVPILVIGGLGNIQGAFPAAILMGVIQALAAVLVPSYYNLVPTICMVLCIIFKPYGLFTKGGK